MRMSPHQRVVTPAPDWKKRRVQVVRFELEPIPPDGPGFWRPECRPREELHAVFLYEHPDSTLLYYVLPVSKAKREAAGAWSPKDVEVEFGTKYVKADWTYSHPHRPERHFTAYRYEEKGVTFVVHTEDGKLVAKTVWK